MKTTLITGASSGIGEEFARRLAARGENLLLVARSEDKLAALCGELKREHKIEAQYVALDLTEADAPQHLFDETSRRGLEVETLINNAGFGSMGEFTDFAPARDMEMIDLNVKALVALTHLYIRPMRERRRGTIINVASTAAFQGVPYMATYAATKAFVLSFSEALSEENRPYGIRVLALCPGSTDTNFFEVAQGERPPQSIMQTPRQVVETALKAVERNRSHVISGWGNFWMVEAERFAPRSLVARIAGRIVRNRHQKHLNRES
ncbi:MAG TPA: SDR family oxidoreductase [Pyrinomonadaceae bacterium]|jgi:hypothetical protein